MKKIALVVAAGNGTRMNNDIPKQFLFLKNRPVLYYSINAFLNASILRLQIHKGNFGY